MKNDNVKRTKKVLKRSGAKFDERKKDSIKIIEDTKKGSGTFSNIPKIQDIDQLIEFMKQTQKNTKHNIMDLSTVFMEEHANGIEMFLQMAIQLEPNNPVHHHNYGLFLENQELYDNAKDEFKIALEMDKDNEIFRVDYDNLVNGLNKKI